MRTPRPNGRPAGRARRRPSVAGGVTLGLLAVGITLGGCASSTGTTEARVRSSSTPTASAGLSPMPSATAMPEYRTPDLRAAPAAAPPAVAPGVTLGLGRVAPMSASEPARVVIPSIGVDSDVMDLGLNADGTMEVPPGAFPAGWYTGSPTPGELGPAILAGHVDWVGSDGVFHDLLDLAVGDAVSVVRADGSTAVFRVTEVVTFAKSAFPTDRVYGDIDHAGLRLITCGGSFDRAVGHYRDNVVVFAELAAPA